MRRDVEQLVEASVVEESVQKVTARFDQALAKLDSQSLEIVSAFFDGKTAEELATIYSTSLTEMQELLSRIRRDLNKELRTGVRVKQ